MAFSRRSSSEAQYSVPPDAQIRRAGELGRWAYWRALVRLIYGISLALFIQLSNVSSMAVASDSVSASWQGEWSWGGPDQMGIQYGGSLSIKDCDQTGCAYELSTGSARSVCGSEGRFRFSSPSKAVHEREGEDFQNKKVACLITFERRDPDMLVTGSDGSGCAIFCGHSGNFGGDFRRWSSVPMYHASFNCRSAKQNIEKTICTHKILAELDRELSGRYGTLQEILSPETKQLRVEQQQWLKKRDQTCGTAADIAGCLETAYRQRTAELNKAIGAACGLSGNAKRCKGVRIK